LIELWWDHLKCRVELSVGMDFLAEVLRGQLQQITLRYALSGADVSVDIVAMVLNPNSAVTD
jgi:hypothetical protein